MATLSYMIIIVTHSKNLLDWGCQESRCTYRELKRIQELKLENDQRGV